MSRQNDLKLNPYICLAVAIVTTSFASIFIRWSSASAYVVAFYRLFFSSLILLPPVLLRYKKELLELISIRRFAPIGLAGLFLSLHFVFWITSLNHTPVANSVMFVSTQPIFALVLGKLIFKEKSTIMLYTGILCAVAGCLFIGGGDLMISGTYVYGDLLALGGAFWGAGYLLAGKWARRETHIIPYVFSVYGFSTAVLAGMILFRGESFVNYTATDYSMFILLAVFPTILGHSMYNYSVKYLPSVTVNMATVGEPVGATILAYLIFGEKPGGYFFIGSILLISAIVLSVKSSMKQSEQIEY